MRQGILLCSLCQRTLPQRVSLSVYGRKKSTVPVPAILRNPNTTYREESVRVLSDKNRDEKAMQEKKLCVGRCYLSIRSSLAASSCKLEELPPCATDTIHTTFLGLMLSEMV